MFLLVFLVVRKLVLVGICRNAGLVENMAEIGQILYSDCGWSLASDEVCPEKTCVNAEMVCRNHRESELILEK